MFSIELKKRREELGITQQMLASRIEGCSRQAVGAWEKRGTTPKRELWALIDNALEVYPGWVAEKLSGHNVETADENDLVPVAFTPIGSARKIPLISWVQAGEWQTVEDPFSPGDAEEWISTTEKLGKHAFALTVHGDSMEPEFNSGDILTIDPDRSAASGSYVIAKNGEEATFKQLVLDGSSVYLKPLNDRYPIKDMTGVDFRIVGVVVEKRKRY